MMKKKKTINRYFYLCNGKMWCSKRADGKKNEYCHVNSLDTEWCKYTQNKDFAKNKTHKFNTMTHENDECIIIDHWEVDDG